MLYAPTVKAGLRTDDFPWGPTRGGAASLAQATAEEWGTDAFAASWVARLAPSAAGRRAVRRVGGEDDAHGREPGDGAAFMRMQSLMDAREVLPLIRVPTLVLDRAEARLPKGPVDMPPLEESRYIAERIPGAKLVALPGQDYLPWVGDSDSVVSEVAQFVTGAAPVATAGSRARSRCCSRTWSARRSAPPSSATPVAGAPRAAQRSRTSLPRRVPRAGDRPGGRRLSRHVRRPGARHSLCPGDRHIRCRREGLEIRAGVHSGEVELLDQGVGGISVHVGARVAAEAGPGEVLVTSTVKDLVAGSGIDFVERGDRVLKGVPGSWRLFAAAAA